MWLRFSNEGRRRRHLLTTQKDLDALEFDGAPSDKSLHKLAQYIEAYNLPISAAEDPISRLKEMLSFVLGTEPSCVNKQNRLRQKLIWLNLDGDDLDLIESQSREDGGVELSFVTTLARLKAGTPKRNAYLGLEKTWVGQADFALGYTLNRRDSFREEQYHANKAQHHKWVPEGATEDLAKVIQTAQDAFETRMAANNWELIWPSDQDRHLDEAREFENVINERCPDLWIDLSEETGIDPDDDKIQVSQDRLADVAGSDDTGSVKIWRWNLSFWPGYALYEIHETQGLKPKRTQVVWCRDADQAGDVANLVTLLPMDGTSPPVHFINGHHGETGWHLEERHALDYLRFFCDVLHGQGGAFTVVETPDDLKWRGLSVLQKSNVQKLIHPLRRWPSLDETEDTSTKPGLRVSATVVYAQSLFRAFFRIPADGVVEMLDDDVLTPELPILPRLWTEKTHFLLSMPSEASHSGHEEASA